MIWIIGITLHIPHNIILYLQLKLHYFYSGRQHRVAQLADMSTLTKLKWIADMSMLTKLKWIKPYAFTIRVNWICSEDHHPRSSMCGSTALNQAFQFCHYYVHCTLQILDIK